MLESFIENCVVASFVKEDPVEDGLRTRAGR